MWVFSEFWRPRQKKPISGNEGSEGNINDPYLDSRDSSLSNDGHPSSRYYTDIESGRGQHYRDGSLDSSINGNSSSNTPILARTEPRSSLKPIVTSYWVERSPTRSRWTRFRSCLPFSQTETDPVLTPDSPTPPDRSCASYIRKIRKSCVFRWVIFLIFLFFITLFVAPIPVSFRPATRVNNCIGGSYNSSP
jgi:hypothetical protein